MSSKFVAAFALALALLASAADARPYRRPAALPHVAVSRTVAFMAHLRDGGVATVYTDGRVTIAAPRATTAGSRAKRMLAALQAARTRRAPLQTYVPPDRYGPLDGDVPAAVRRAIVADLERPAQRYAAGEVVVVFKPGVTIAQDRVALPAATASALRRAVLSKRRDVTPHAFTNDARTNLALMQLGADRTERLFSNVGRAELSAMRSRAEARIRRSLVQFDNAFTVHVGASSVEKAVRTLRAEPSVAYVAPDYAVTPALAARHPVPAEAVREMETFRRSPHVFGRSIKSAAPPAIPSNSAVQFNLQALLDAPGVDAVAAFDEIGRQFGQLPGAGEIVTNVGIGDVDDASAATNPSDPCQAAVQSGGATTHAIGGQRYLDLPSLPLIPVWVADPNGNLSTTNEVCDVDPTLGEVGLDFSVMAPLPHDAQRPGAVAPIGADLLGIAPGASYRWIAPGTTNGGVYTSNTLGALMGAARQQPAPNVITASLGFGADVYGFPGRYLEDDPLVQSVVAGIVSSNVVVCIAANDGTRLFTAAAVGPSGGSAPTNTGPNGTAIDDLYFTTAPSVVPDSGAIDAGATTLDDVFSANPQDPSSGALANVPAFAETRFNGMLGYSSGFGSRVSVSAPGDGVQSLYRIGPAYNAVTTVISGGTSASAPEAAAAAAVALQVARLTGHRFAGATQVRDALAASGTPVATPPQSDVPLNVGPQISVRRVVEHLLAAAGKPVQPGIARVAVHGRRSGSFIALSNTREVNDAVFTTALDPSYIKLDGPFTPPAQGRRFSFPGSDTGADLNSYLTIAPDWEGIPANAVYRLTVAGQPARVIATTPFVRMLPAQLFATAGVPLTPGASRTLSLTYTASVGLHAVAQSTFQLTFGPPAPASRLVLAPVVPPVVSGATIPVAYDIRGYPAGLAAAPALRVSLPGVGNLPFVGFNMYPYYSAPLTGTHGTVNVPVSALAGAGTYAIWIDLQPGLTAFPSDFSDIAFTRVDAGTARPPAPLLSATRGGPPSHTLFVPWKSTFAVSYDVSNVPRATGAIVEISAPPPGPAFYNSPYLAGFNTFRNPNGNALDDDGAITGSIYHVQSSGATGTVTIDPEVASIPATASVNVRVIPTAGGVPVAEASDADTVTYGGIESALGQALNNVYMNPNGTDGYLSEAANFGIPQANFNFLTFEPFDLATGTVSGIPLTSTTLNSIMYPIVQDDVGLAFTTTDFTGMNYYRAAPIANGFSPFSFPAAAVPATAFVTTAATDSTSTRSAYLGLDLATGAVIATRGDVATGNGFAPAIDVTALLGPDFDGAGLFQYAYDPNADKGYLLAEDASTACDQQSPQLVTVDYSSGTAASQTLPVGGGIAGLGEQGYHMAVDPVTHTAAIATSCEFSVQTAQGAFRAELSVVDLSSGKTTRVFQHVLTEQQLFHGVTLARGGDSATVGIDPVNHLVLQRSTFCPQLLGPVDVNARACLNLYDESGRLAKTVPGLFPDGFGDFGAVFNGVNGARRTGVANGQEQYSQFIYSLSVQPYRY